MESFKKHGPAPLIILLSACLLVNLFFCYGKDSLASTVYGIVFKGNREPLRPIVAVDSFCSKLEKGKVLLKFEGFESGNEATERIVPLIYFRAVFAYYPGRILTGDPSLVIRKGNEFLEKPFNPNEEWLKQNNVNYQVKFVRTKEGAITTDVRELSKVFPPREARGAIPLIMRLLVLAASVLIIIFLVLYLRHMRENASTSGCDTFKTDSLSLFSIVTISVMFLLVCCHSLLMPLYEWDAFAIWGLKAKVLYCEGLSSSYFNSPNLAYSHLDYPILVPLLMSAGIFSIASDSSDATCKYIFPLFYLAFVFLMYTAARRRLGQRHALLLTAIFASTPALVRWSGAGTADMALSFLYAGSILYLINFFETEKFYDLGISIICSICCALTKNEGLPLVIINFVALLIFSSKPLFSMKNLKAPALYFTASTIFYLPWLIFSQDIPKIHENYIGNLTIARFAGNLDRLQLIIPEMLLQFLSLKSWGLIWLLAIVAAVAGRKSFLEKPVLLLWFLFIGHILLYMLIYIIYPFELAKLIPETIERLYLHLMPAGILIIIMHLSSYCRDQKK